MNTIEFTKKYKALTGIANVYPNTIPDDKDSCTGVFTYGGTADRYLTTGKQKFQFLCVGLDRQVTELTATQQMNAFRTFPMEGQDVDSQLILNVELLQIAPMYVGKDERGRYKFSFNIEIQIQIHN